MKYILLLVIAIVVWRLLVKRAQSRREAAPVERPMQEMVKCCHCGVYLPEAESVVASGRFYCSEAHRLAGSDPA